MTTNDHPEGSHVADKRLARLVLFTFVLTFVAARILVLLIMTQQLPDFFLHVGGTHVHHLNYGIFLLCGVGAYLLFAHPTGGRLRLTAVFYAIGLALTFDEFGMWLHLGGSYWQRASYDAIGVITGTLGYIAFFPSRQAIRQWNWWQAVVMAVVIIGFFVMVADSFRHINKMVEPTLEQIEKKGPK